MICSKSNGKRNGYNDTIISKLPIGTNSLECVLYYLELILYLGDRLSRDGSRGLALELIWEFDTLIVNDNKGI